MKKNCLLILTTIINSFNYISWFLLASCFLIVKNDLEDTMIIELIICLIIVYLLKLFFSFLNQKFLFQNYFDIKHNVELNYFKELEKVKISSLNKFSLSDLSKDILDCSYLKTKIIYDIGNVLIPFLFGITLLFFETLRINLIISIILIVILLTILILSFVKSDNIVHDNSNYLLNDFINKIVVIKKMNIYSFFNKKLDEYKNTCTLENKEPKIKFHFIISIILILLFISIIILIGDTLTKLGLIIFYTITLLKLGPIIFNTGYLIKEIKELIQTKEKLTNYYDNLTTTRKVKNWQTIQIIDGIVKYSTINIKIPDFQLKRKDHISIMGAQGEGKSTVLNILSGVKEIDSGELFFDDKKINGNLDFLYLSKNTPLFKISLKDNLAFNVNIKDDVLLDMIHLLNLDNWFNALPNGLNTIMDMKLSNPVLQKLNIIKSLILDKDIYFFDDPTSDLDIETEKIISNIIKNKFQDKTVIIVTHRPLLTTICKTHYFIKNHILLESEPLL